MVPPETIDFGGTQRYKHQRNIKIQEKIGHKNRNE